MMASSEQLNDVNVLASAASWAWPQALRDLFQPRGVNLLMAESPADFVNIIERKRIHTAIVDLDAQASNGLAAIRIIRMEYPFIPCIVLATAVDVRVLGRALELDVFGVVDKPVDMNVLQELLNRLFLKRYRSDIFSR